MDFMRFLPREAPAHPEMKDLEAVAAACINCGEIEEYPHACVGAWTKIRSLVQKETHEALDQMDESERAQAEQGELGDSKLTWQGLARKPSDHVLVHMRLEFSHRQALFPSKSYFEGIVTPDTQKVTMLHMPYTTAQVDSVRDKGGHIHQTYDLKVQKSIGIVLQGYKSMFEDLCEHHCIVEMVTGSQRGDFAMLARHNGAVFCSGSSYCLWAAYANVYGPTYFAADKPWADGKQPDIQGGKGLGFKWVDKPLLHATAIRWFEKMTAEQVVDWINKN